MARGEGPISSERMMPLCFRCGAAAVTTRDASGRAICARCEAMARGRAKAGGGAGSGGAGLGATPATTRAPTDPEVIELSPADGGGRTRAPCPVCGAAQQVGVAVCGSCGHDPRKVPLAPGAAREVLGDFDAPPDATRRERGEPAKAAKVSPAPEPLRCRGCQYDLSGLAPDGRNFVTCPECGQSRSARKRDGKLAEDAARVARDAVVRPLRMLGIGLGLSVLLLLARGWWVGGAMGALSGPLSAGGGWETAMLSLAGGLGVYAAYLVMGMLVVYGASLLWLHLDGSFWMTLLQVAAAQAASLALVLLLWAVPLPIPTLVVLGLAGFLYAYLVADLLDIYVQDGAILALLTHASVIVPGIAVMALV